MTRSTWLRKLILTIHLSTAVGWLGAVVAYLALGLAAAASRDAPTVRAAWIALELIGWFVIAPLAVSALLTGIALSLGTPWGLFRHYWVVISLGLTIFATGILLFHLPTVSALATLVRTTDDARLSGLGGDLVHAGGGLLLLIAITVLNVYKPQGLTAYGWRRQQAARWAARPEA